MHIRFSHHHWENGTWSHIVLLTIRIFHLKIKGSKCTVELIYCYSAKFRKQHHYCVVEKIFRPALKCQSCCILECHFVLAFWAPQIFTDWEKKKKSIFHMKNRQGRGSQEISLWSDMLSADIRSLRRYLQLSGNIRWPIEGCQTGRVNKMMTSISQPQARKACQSQGSS